MTEEEFWAELGKYNGQFQLNTSFEGSIRCEDGNCPIIKEYNEIIGKEKFRNRDWFYAALRLKLDTAFARDIVIAADDLIYAKKEVRQKLLEVLELS